MGILYPFGGVGTSSSVHPYSGTLISCKTPVFAAALRQASTSRSYYSYGPILNLFRIILVATALPSASTEISGGQSNQALRVRRNWVWGSRPKGTSRSRPGGKESQTIHLDA